LIGCGEDRKLQRRLEARKLQRRLEARKLQRRLEARKLDRANHQATENPNLPYHLNLFPFPPKKSPKTHLQSACGNDEIIGPYPWALSYNSNSGAATSLQFFGTAKSAKNKRIKR
jgi:hypothetical protein